MKSLFLSSLLIIITNLGIFASDETATSETLRELSENEIKAFVQKGIDETQEIEVVWSRFKQQRHLAVFEEVLKAEGEMAFSRDGQLRWELHEPFRSVLIRGKSGVGKWEHKDESWRKMQLGGEAALSQMLERIGGWMQGDLSVIEKEGFKIRIYRVEERNVWQIEMTPTDKKQREYIKKIIMRLEGERPEIRHVTLYESGDNRTEIAFDGRVLNPELPDGYFDPTHEPVTLKKPPEQKSAKK